MSRSTPEKVVYFLGAGFSAPLGLPVTADFLEKSKDQFIQDRDRYGFFGDVFDRIEGLAKIKNFFSSDQFNIEEVLSILEMQAQLEKSGIAEKQFVQYIQEVINFHTPTFRLDDDVRDVGNWQSLLFGSDPTHNDYGYFVAGLLNLEIRRPEAARREPIFAVEAAKQPKAVYSIVTVNYDTVLERLVKHLAQHYGTPITTDRVADDDMKRLVPTKLHGSADTDVVVLPTWNKGVQLKMLEVWKEAHEVFGQANHVRIIGYSLPESDNYVRYLLKSAILKSSNLKKVDVLCRDPQGDVKRRYDAFVELKFPRYRFCNADVAAYLTFNRERYAFRKGDGIDFGTLEEAHEAFFSSLRPDRAT
jgi:SIR2-like protein